MRPSWNCQSRTPLPLKDGKQRTQKEPPSELSYCNVVLASSRSIDRSVWWSTTGTSTRYLWVTKRITKTSQTKGPSLLRTSEDQHQQTNPVAMASFLTPPTTPAAPLQEDSHTAMLTTSSSSSSGEGNNFTGTTTTTSSSSSSSSRRNVLSDITRWNNEGVSWIQRGQYSQAIPVLFQALAASREMIHDDTAAKTILDPPAGATAAAAAATYTTFRGEMCLDELLLTNEDSGLDSFCSSTSSSTTPRGGRGVWSSSSSDAPPAKRQRSSTTKSVPPSSLSIFQRPIPLPEPEQEADPRDSPPPPSYEEWVIISTVITFNTGLAMHLVSTAVCSSSTAASLARLQQKAAKLYQLVLCLLEQCHDDRNETKNDDMMMMMMMMEAEEEEGFGIFREGQRTFALIVLNNLGCVLSSLTATTTTTRMEQDESYGSLSYETEDAAKCFWQIFLVISNHRHHHQYHHQQQQEGKEDYSSHSWEEMDDSRKQSSAASSLSGRTSSSRLVVAAAAATTVVPSTTSRTSTNSTQRMVAARRRQQQQQQQHQETLLLLEELSQNASVVLFDARMVPCAPSA